MGFIVSDALCVDVYLGFMGSFMGARGVCVCVCKVTIFKGTLPLTHTGCNYYALVQCTSLHQGVWLLLCVVVLADAWVF